MPFTYSIETLGSSFISNTSARSFDKSNINDHVVWLLPNENQSWLILSYVWHWYLLLLMIRCLEIIKLPRELNQNSFILANLDGFGFFRVNYDENNWNMILEQLSRNRQVDNVFFMSYIDFLVLIWLIIMLDNSDSNASSNRQRLVQLVASEQSKAN